MNMKIAHAARRYTQRGRHPGTTPPHLEHGTFITRELAARAAATGVMVVQPLFLGLASYEDVPPIPNGMTMFDHRTLLDAAVVLAGSSDSPVADFDPPKAWRAAVTRRTWSGALLHLLEVLATYTREAARA